MSVSSSVLATGNTKDKGDSDRQRVSFCFCFLLEKHAQKQKIHKTVWLVVREGPREIQE